jgi:hypothetical protein
MTQANIGSRAYVSRCIPSSFSHDRRLGSLWCHSFRAFNAQSSSIRQSIQSLLPWSPRTWRKILAFDKQGMTTDTGNRRYDLTAFLGSRLTVWDPEFVLTVNLPFSNFEGVFYWIVVSSNGNLQLSGHGCLCFITELPHLSYSPFQKSRLDSGGDTLIERAKHHASR